MLSFEFTGGDRSWEVNGCNSGVDSLAILGATPDDLTTTRDGNDTQIGATPANGDYHIQLFDAALIGVNDFIFV